MGGVRETHWEGAGPRLTTAGVLTLPEPERGAVRTQLESCMGRGAPHKRCGLWERGAPDRQTWQGGRQGEKPLTPSASDLLRFLPTAKLDWKPESRGPTAASVWSAAKATGRMAVVRGRSQLAG